MLHGEILKSIIYNHIYIYGKSILDLVIVLFQINFHLNQNNFFKMDNELYRYFVKIRTILEIDSKTIHEELVTALGPSALSYTTATRWARRFRQGREDVNDHPQSACPALSQFTDENIELVRQVISNDPHSAYDKIIAETSLSHGTIQRIIHDCLKMKQLTSRWVSHQQRVKLRRENLEKFQNGSWRRCDIITDGETWIYHRQIHRKSENASWLDEGELTTTVVHRSKKFLLYFL